jgi:general secretion pathway protein G
MNMKPGIGIKTEPSGFTLIELLVVLSIVALLMTMALPRYFNSLERSHEVVLKENLQVMRSLLDKFYADKGRFPESLTELVEQRYLRAIPIDPISDTDKSWISIPAKDTEKGGISDVKSGAQGVDKNGQPYESY